MSRKYFPLFFFYLLLLLLISHFPEAFAVCPHKQTGLTKWSSVSAYNVANANVTIASGTSVLFDKTSALTLSSITINGTLIFNDS